MKINIEIVDGEFKYEYSLFDSKSRRGGKPLNEDCLMLFCEVMRSLRDVSKKSDSEERDAKLAYMLLKAHPEWMNEVEKKHKEREEK